MTGAMSRNKGARAERAVVAYLRRRGFDGARRHNGADGRAPGDIAGVPGVTIEVKDRASSSFPSWRLQLVAECAPGDLALLVRKTANVTDVGAWTAEMPLRDWFWLVHERDIVAPEVRDCRRTGEKWVRTTVADIVNMLGPA